MVDGSGSHSSSRPLKDTQEVEFLHQEVSLSRKSNFLGAVVLLDEDS